VIDKLNTPIKLTNDNRTFNTKQLPNWTHLLWRQKLKLLLVVRKNGLLC